MGWNEYTGFSESREFFDFFNLRKAFSLCQTVHCVLEHGVVGETGVFWDSIIVLFPMLAQDVRQS